MAAYDAPHDLGCRESHSQNRRTITVSNSTIYIDMKNVSVILKYLIFYLYFIPIFEFEFLF